MRRNLLMLVDAGVGRAVRGFSRVGDTFRQRGRQSRLVSLTIFCLALATGPAWAEQTTQSPPSKPVAPAMSKMTNADVIQMVTAGLSEQIITTSIRQALAKDFDLTPTGLIALKKAGVPDAVILAMQEVNASVKSVSAGSDKMSTDDRETASDDPNAKVRQELILIEHQISTAEIRGDKATINKFLADDFKLFQDGKSYSKAQYLEKVKPLKNINTTNIENAKLSFEGEIAAFVWRSGDSRPKAAKSHPRDSI